MKNRLIYPVCKARAEGVDDPSGLRKPWKGEVSHYQDLEMGRQRFNRPSAKLIFLFVDLGAMRVMFC
ncbi:hypothetical protein CWS72_10615 [Telmatospirillum siberiense]|uniref:Uncharacterized protein n=1 Tax=Telmatospirillum siberiense TaxID=382514 RepID=A0A2N3PVY9_9PROT|nr:hypothetical protein CWS72_10615 [Telmatospirillum siberiense]